MNFKERVGWLVMGLAILSWGIFVGSHISPAPKNGIPPTPPPALIQSICNEVGAPPGPRPVKEFYTCVSTVDQTWTYARGEK